MEMINAVCDVVDIPVIASGGCGSIQDIVDVFEKTIYFSIRNEDDTLTYYKINDGKASILFE